MFDFSTGRGMHIVGDVHGDADEYQRQVDHALDNDLHFVALGDFTDRGPASDVVMRVTLDLHDEGKLNTVVGNHDDRLWRWANGNNVKLTHGLAETLEQVGDDTEVVQRWHAAMPDWPMWATVEAWTFVHAAFHPVMLTDKIVAWKDKKTYKAIAARALCGQTTGWKTDEGYPERLYDWHDEIPAGHTVFFGHDYIHDTVTTVAGAGGGHAVFMDTGAGKEGKLSSKTVLF